MSAEEDAGGRIAALERELEALRAALAERDATPFGEGLREREALLSEAERIVHLGCWMWEPATGAIHWSDEMFRLFGLLPRSIPLTTESFFERIHPGDVERIRAMSARSLETNVPEAVDFRIVRADGATRSVHMEAAFVRSEGGARLVGTVLDVTERLELEQRLQQAQKMEALGTLAGGVAHDFNNYLQVVFGHLDLLAARRVGDADTLAALAQIRDAAERCRRLTRQLVLFSRGGVTTEPEIVSIDAVLDHASPMFAALLGDAIRLRRVRAELDVRARCDRGGLEQVVLNLLVNARDAMPQGGRITLEVSTRDVAEGHPTLPPGRYAVLAVEDEGAGIAPELLPRIFEPFFSTKGVGRGTGLGLAIAHGIVTRHGGAIEVESAPGRSATFRVVLPVAEPVPRVLSSPPPPPTEGVRAVILVVEDQDGVRALVRRLLTSDGFVVLEAVDGAAALEVLRARSDVDLVLSDIAMPRMTGVELLHAAARERPRTPVILMGGVIDSNVAGLDVPVLSKPFAREDLLRVVREALAARGE